MSTVSFAGPMGKNEFFYPVRYRSGWQCFGGGMNLKSSEYSITHMRPENIGGVTCKMAESSKGIGQEYASAKAKVDELVNSWRNENVTDGPGCYDVKVILQKFLNSIELVEELNSQYALQRNDLLKEVVAKKDIQNGASFLSYASSQCNASHLIERNMIYWYMLVDLIRRSERGPTLKVAEDAETIPDCANVRLSSRARVRRFFIDMKYASGEKYMLAWQYDGDPVFKTRISSGSDVLYESPCSGSSSKIETTLDINKEIHPIITIDILDDCPGERTTAPTPWSLEFSCQSQGIEDDCGNRLNELVTATKEFLETSKKALDHYWQQGLCFKQLDKAMMTNFDDKGNFGKLASFQYAYPPGQSPPATPSKSISSQGDKVTLEQEGGQLADKVTESLMEKLESRLVAPDEGGDKAEKEQTSTKVSAPEGEIFAAGLHDFRNNKNFYCGTRPEYDLFKTVSWAYCSFAFEHLLPDQ